MIDSFPKTGISEKELAALVVARKISRNLVEKHPDIAEQYLAGMKIKDIGEQHGLLQEHESSVVQTAIRMALQQLLPEDELRDEADRRRRVNGATIGQYILESRRGIFGMSREAKLQQAAKSTATQRRERIGIFAISEEQHMENLMAGVRKRGDIPWTDNIDPVTGLNELEYALRLMVDAAFIHQAGKLRNQPDYKKIAEKINTVFHQGQPVRNAKKVSRIRKKKGLSLVMPRKHPLWTERIHTTLQLNEEEYLKLIADIPRFKMADGRPDFSAIAQHLNTVFHEGRDVRSKISTEAKFLRLKK